MARLFIDTEFNGFGGQLMSMALVSDDGREWYQVLPEPSVFDKWVFENVFPILNKAPMSRREFQLSLKIFLEQFDKPTIYADWYTDLAHFFNAMAGDNHGTSFSLPCSAVLLKDVPDLQPELPHNALSDARALRDWYVDASRCPHCAGTGWVDDENWSWDYPDLPQERLPGNGKIRCMGCDA
ncbi:hypothetical protein EN781_00480 [Mesorhizobium sp. M4A.F.Ca.ET.090.04.2.1]|uniref:hypothetical protein n=1 Tax=Mesorhizobium sp. M4A.F.Ca.ET.090.04.2.1 TaxID=2496663 RepID=UPI000FCAE6DE|nr:hypothetical protein [Mesorhizobium sp. M4A.F.Ca.ET.090.04.2.1]RVC47645.1 hypothetical protein EN781_00480 [Mesorhizobium sp. M4A.F.Ca.ET.090.04.2.1]